MTRKVCAWCGYEITKEYETGFETNYEFGTEISKEKVNSKSKKIYYHKICADKQNRGGE